MAESGVVQFVDLAVDRPVERITLLFRACLIGPSGLPDNGQCIMKTSFAFGVAQAVQSLKVKDLALSVKAGRMTSTSILLFNGPQEAGKAPSTATVELSAVNTTGTNTVEGILAMAAVDGEALFDSFYFRDVGVVNVTFKVYRGGVLRASVHHRCAQQWCELQLAAGGPAVRGSIGAARQIWQPQPSAQPFRDCSPGARC
jgi:hypothetical protein